MGPISVGSVSAIVKYAIRVCGGDYLFCFVLESGDSCEVVGISFVFVIF